MSYIGGSSLVIIMNIMRHDGEKQLIKLLIGIIKLWVIKFKFKD